MSTEVRLLISWLLGYSDSDNIQVVLVVPHIIVLACLVLRVIGHTNALTGPLKTEIVYDLDGSLADGDKE